MTNCTLFGRQWVKIVTTFVQLKEVDNVNLTSNVKQPQAMRAFCQPTRAGRADDAELKYFDAKNMFLVQYKFQQLSRSQWCAPEEKNR